jgi:predicted transcriptional regulator
MSIQIPADVEATIQQFMATGEYSDVHDLLRQAIAALEQQTKACAAIEEGMDDEAAGRMTPAREVIETAKQGLAPAAK